MFFRFEMIEHGEKWYLYAYSITNDDLDGIIRINVDDNHEIGYSVIVEKLCSKEEGGTLANECCYDLYREGFPQVRVFCYG